MGLVVADLEHVVIHAHTNKSSHKPPTYIQQTVTIFTIEHVYRHATLFRVFPGRAFRHLG